MQWGRIFARGIERDPRNGNLWVTGLDGSIYTMISCESTILDVSVTNGRAKHLGASIIDLTPNPSYGDVQLRFALGEQSHVQISLYDMKGQSVAFSLPDAIMSAGEHEYMLDTRGLASGMYLCRLEENGHSVAVRALFLIR